MRRIANIGRTSPVARQALREGLRDLTGQEVCIYPNGDIVCTNRAADIILHGGKRIGQSYRDDQQATDEGV